MVKVDRLLSRYDVIAQTGLTISKAEMLLKKYGKHTFGIMVIGQERLNGLIADGTVELLKLRKPKQMAAENDRLEDRVYNLTLYLSYIRENHKDLWVRMEDEFSGMPGFTDKVINK